MTKFALISVLLLLSSLTGCLGSDDGFEWPSPTEQECSIVVEYNLECEVYISGSESPHYSLINPETGDLWIIYLSGFIKAWDGESLTEIVDLSSITGRCHMEQGLLYHLMGKTEDSLKHLSKAKNIHQKLYTISIKKKIQTLVTNETFDSYYGSLFERSLIHFYLTLGHFKLYQKIK